MLHSYTRVFVHLIWSTKRREPLLSDDVRPKVKQHMLDNAEQKHISLDSLAVQNEHVHALINLPSDQTVEAVVRLLKGESSHWINAQNLADVEFSWQRGYGAFSVSSSDVGAVRAYIRNQDKHHRKKTFAEEHNEFLVRHGFSACIPTASM
jgi:REP element-mobilizing transposase RayT